MPYIKVMERRNAEFVLRGRGVQEREILITAKNLSEMLMRRGVRFAPVIDVKIDNREYVDRELHEAIRQSQELKGLLQASPSFIAWF